MLEEVFGFVGEHAVPIIIAGIVVSRMKATLLVRSAIAVLIWAVLEAAAFVGGMQ